MHESLNVQHRRIGIISGTPSFTVDGEKQILWGPERDGEFISTEKRTKIGAMSTSWTLTSWRIPEITGSITAQLHRCSAQAFRQKRHSRQTFFEDEHHKQADSVGLVVCIRNTGNTLVRRPSGTYRVCRVNARVGSMHAITKTHKSP